MKKLLSILAVVGLVLTSAVVFASQADIVTICHATGSESNPFVTIHVPENAIAGHFENNGTPKAGHEDDLLFPGEVDCPGPTPPVDVCPNIDGDQATVPEGKELVDGQCVDIVPPTDVCPNIEGDQATVPEGKEIVNGECVDITTPPTDVCPNIEGDQATVPEGKELVDGQCVDITTPPTDLCNNIDGVQEVVPEGMEAHDGVCAVPEEETGGGGGGSHHHHSSSGSRPIGAILGTSTCVLPEAITGFDVQSAVPNDGQNELVWNKLNSYTVKAGDNFNPFTGISILNPVPGSVIYGTNITSVNIRWWQDGNIDIAYQSTLSANDGFEAITGLPNGTHHWFQLQPVNDCGTGDWGVAVDPLP